MLIDEPKFSEILPESLRSDEKILAAAKAVDDELKKLSDAIKHVLHLPRLDELDSDVLDHLAWQYHVDNYSAEFSEVIKRKMIRESIYLHKIKGTPEAVLLALKPFSENPELEEWWQYAGEPYFFKLVLHNLVDVGDDGEELLRTIYDAKNVRSWLELITFDFSDEEAHGLYHGALEQEGGEEFTDLSGMDESEDGGIYHAIGELDAGFEFTDLDFSAQTDSAICSCAILELEGGIEFTDCDFSGDVEPAPVVNTETLRLYFNFPNHSVRLISVEYPRKNIQAGEIKQLGDFSAEKKILINSKGYITDGICRAVILSKKTEVIL